MSRGPLSSKLEVWGGVECTVNRVQDTYFDQLKYNGHDRRIEDLERFAEIGLKAIRYPFLWERIAPKGVKEADWSWADERLARLRELGMRPIAGLVHHGSGPRYTSLMDPGFGPKLAEYAAAFARRYPWVEDYTPINESFTTARFSALYGVWYPHRRDYLSCFQALLNECRGVVLSMREIRKVNPRARLIQTDDLGKASSTPLLSYQVEFENERRWIGWDLLCGRIEPGHALWDFILGSGIPEADVLWFAENPCPPDILGVNHYLLSNRHLDERMALYPEWSHGGNHRHAYADVESVRLRDAEWIPPKTIFREAWERYRIPLAATEVHLDAGREDQLRWYMEIWNAARELRQEGVDFRAITAWGLLGHFDWHCLVSRCEGYYESGVFDIRGGKARPTAIARLLKSLSETEDFRHPALESPGWWRRPTRVWHPERVMPPEPGSEESFGRADSVNAAGKRPILITGARGTLGRAFARICEGRGLPYRLVSRDEMDIARPESVEAALTELDPWAVINTAGYVRVDEAEGDRERCFRENVEGPRTLAEACARHGLPFVTYSTDLVFDGRSEEPYVESSPAAPLNVYGESKLEAEKAVLAAHPGALVIRTSAFFGPWDECNFVTSALRALAQGKPFVAASDSVVSPTYVPDLVETTLNLLFDGEKGVRHLANEGRVSWHELAAEVARRAGYDPSLVVASVTAGLGLSARRPAFSALGSERGMLLPPLTRALDRYFEQNIRRTPTWTKDESESLGPGLLAQ